MFVIIIVYYISFCWNVVYSIILICVISCYSIIYCVSLFRYVVYSVIFSSVYLLYPIFDSISDPRTYDTCITTTLASTHHYLHPQSKTPDPNIDTRSYFTSTNDDTI